MPLFLDKQYLEGYVAKEEIEAFSPQVLEAHTALHSKTGAGSEYLGWLDLPCNTGEAAIAEINAMANEMAEKAQILLVVGIGGSYMGAKAAVDFLQLSNKMQVLFLGNDLSAQHIISTFSLCRNKDVCVNVISKSGSTTETGVAFRFVLDFMDRKYGSEAAGRIYCTTDKTHGTLRKLCNERGYKSLVIPSDIGGRYSVLTPAGLLPIAAAGGDIAELINGACCAQAEFANPILQDNICYEYAVIRYILEQKGKEIELFASCEPIAASLNQWLVQLFGESQGKDGKGIFPACAQYTTDLHSLGQYLQQGKKILFESIMSFTEPPYDMPVSTHAENFDGLQYLEGMTVSEINNAATHGTARAHSKGGTPVLIFQMSKASPYSLGYMFYFFEKACAIGGYIMGINPFNQPGVEGYKENMFALLGKPGYENFGK